MSILILFLYFLALYFCGSLFSFSYLRNKDSGFGSVAKVALNCALGLGLHISSSHLLSFITHSFNISSKITFGLILLASVYHLIRHKTNTIEFSLNKCEIWAFALALLFAAFGGIRGHLTDSDNTHIAWISSIVNNNVYPPVLPVNPDYSLNFYHYGVDLTGAAISSITGLMPWDTLSVQVGIGTFLVFLALFSTFNFFWRKPFNSLLATLIVFFYTSTISLEFILKYFPQIINSAQASWPAILNAWQNASLPAIGHIPYFSVLVSQNPAIVALLMIFLISFIGEGFEFKNKKFLYCGIIFLSFLAYFYYPAYWYPSLVGLFVFGALKANYRLHYLCVLVSMVLGKLITFQFSSTEFEGGIKALLWKPSLYWDHFNMNYLYYFDFKPDGFWAKPITDYVSGKTIFSMHMFSLDSFRNFGFILICALLLLVYLSQKKKLDNSVLYLLAGLPAIPVPFLFKFVLKPSENYRFLSWTVVICLVFIVLVVGRLVIDDDNFIAKLSKIKMVTIPITFALVLIMGAGLVSILPFRGYNNYAEHELLSKAEKNALKAMMKIHKSGEIALSGQIFYTFCDMGNVAGFFGVGGQFYKPDLTTMQTAIRILNPVLLQELSVDYVLIDQRDQLTETALMRLQDSQLFAEVPEIHNLNPDWRFYKFIGNKLFDLEEIQKYSQEYKWVLGTKVGEGYGNFKYFVFDQGLVYVSQNRITLNALAGKVRELLLKNKDIPSAMWLGAQVLSSEELYKPQLEFKLVQ